MDLPDVDLNKVVTISTIGRAAITAQLESVGLRAGATIKVLGRTASRGLLVKVDDTRVVIGFELARSIICTYPTTE